ncbi:MAG TPA: hypothetical protein VGO47_14920 [Chlamydiales bacterium]|jgi:hypothetical protein|nr:hypothetical protein [Chlamydiales bacterium]
MSNSASEYLAKALLEDCLPSVFLLSGNDAKSVAMDFSAKLLRCPKERIEANNHPDFYCLVPEGKSSLHSIESIRSVIEQSHESGFEGKSIVVLIESAERMQPAAANALLKTLEEPSADSTWILLAERPQDILPTILSRCTKLACQDAIEAQSLGEEGRILQTLLTDKPSYPKLAIELDKIEKLIEGENSQQKAFALLTLVSEHFHQRQIHNPEATNEWEEPLALLAVALERNIKLFTCLEYLFLKCSRN